MIAKTLSYSSLLLITACSNEKISEKKVNNPDFKNVVFIVSDDHTYKALGCYGNDIIRTPNIDKLASEGILFENAYSNSPLCSSSRQSMLTAKYPHATGVTLLFTPFRDENNQTIAEQLKLHDFVTCLIGKSHFNPWVWWPMWQQEGVFPKFGFDTIIESKQWKDYLKANPPEKIPSSIETMTNSTQKKNSKIWGMNPATLPAPYFDKDAEGTFFSNAAVDFIEKNKNRRFCLWLAYHEPHAPFVFPIEYAHKYNPKDVPLPKGTPEDDRWIPEKFRDMTESERRGAIASYYSCVEYMDKNVGIVLNTLKEKGLEENTLIVYVSDQGYLLNEHKRFEKHTMWAESVKSPLIIKGFGKFEQGKKTDALVELIDMVPTALEALGVQKHPDMQGESFYNLLQGKTNEHKEIVFSEFLEDNKAMVATKEWKYIFTTGKRDLGQGYQTGYGPSGIYHRLYNLKSDSDETTNLAYYPENKIVLFELQNKMLDIFIKTHPDAKNLPLTFNIEGKLAWFCEPRDVGAEYGGKPLRVFKKDNKK